MAGTKVRGKSKKYARLTIPFFCDPRGAWLGQFLHALYNFPHHTQVPRIVMGRRLSFIIPMCLCFVFSTFHNSIFVVSQRGGVRIHPEFVPENPSVYPVADAPTPPGPPGANLVIVDTGGKQQPFLHQSKKPPRHRHGLPTTLNRSIF